MEYSTLNNSLIEIYLVLNLFQGEGLHKCKECDLSFNKANHLEEHVANKHRLSCGRKYPTCPRKYRQINNFVVHFKKEHLHCRNKTCSTKNLGAAKLAGTKN